MKPRHLPYLCGMFALGCWWGYRSLGRMNSYLQRPYGPDALLK